MQQQLNQADQKGGAPLCPPIFPKKKRRCLYRLFREKVDKEVEQSNSHPSMLLPKHFYLWKRINARGRQTVMKLWQMKMLPGKSRVPLLNEARDTSVQATLEHWLKGCATPPQKKNWGPFKEILAMIVTTQEECASFPLHNWNLCKILRGIT